MAQCPVCQTELPDDFGLIDCSGCNTPLIVQIDGSVQSALSEAPSSSDPNVVPVSEDTIALGSQQDAEINFENPVLGDEISSTEEQLTQVIEADAPPLSTQATPIDADVYFGEETPEPIRPVMPPQELHDLSTLANDTDAAAQGGSLRYTIHIGGIDTADIRVEFKELISDRRFLWDVDAILKSIKSGNVRLENVTAVKAMLLVQRLRELPLQVQWEQHVAHQA